MKKLLVMVTAAAVMLFAGCKTVPTTDKIYSAAQAVGCASGLVVNETKLDDKARTAIVEIVGIVKDVVPADGQTFADAWSPVAQKYVAELVTAGKLSEGQATLVTGAVSVAAVGLDYVFNMYPKAKEYKDLVAAAVNGLSEGFLLTFKPVDTKAGAKAPKKVIEYDRKAYIYIKSCFQK